MRIFILLASTTALAACGGAGPQSPGSVAISPPAGGTGTATPTPTASFVNPTAAKTYAGIGAVQHYEYKTQSDRVGQGGQLYAGDANTIRDSGISVTYNPRDAIFELTIDRPLGSVTGVNDRFQDPAHRTDFGGAKEPQASVPNLPAAMNIQYLQSGSASGPSVSGGAGNYAVGGDTYASTTQTFFYQKPGTTTQYVTFAGYVRNALSTVKQTRVAANGTTSDYLENSYALDRAAFAYGERTDNSAVPRTGTGTYSGDMIATLVYNPALDVDPTTPTYFQWIAGSNTTTVDFGTLGVTTQLTGTVNAPAYDAYTSRATYLPAGSTFSASATGTIDLVKTGGFTGEFANAKFTTPGGADLVVAIAGSSIDGAFFGPKGEEVGGGFRIVGGTPDQRIDILGTYTGKK